VTWRRCVRRDPPSPDDYGAAGPSPHGYGAAGPAQRGNILFLIHHEETRTDHDRSTNENAGRDKPARRSRQAKAGPGLDSADKSAHSKAGSARAWRAIQIHYLRFGFDFRTGDRLRIQA